MLSYVLCAGNLQRGSWWHMIPTQLCNNMVCADLCWCPCVYVGDVSDVGLARLITWNYPDAVLGWYVLFAGWCETCFCCYLMCATWDLPVHWELQWLCPTCSYNRLGYQPACSCPGLQVHLGHGSKFKQWLWVLGCIWLDCWFLVCGVLLYIACCMMHVAGNIANSWVEWMNGYCTPFSERNVGATSCHVMSCCEYTADHDFIEMAWSEQLVNVLQYTLVT